MPDGFRSVIFAYGCLVLLSLVEGVVLGFEKTAAFLLMTLLTLPSIVGYVLCANYLNRWSILKQVAFFAPFILVVGVCVVQLMSWSTDEIVYPLTRWFLVLHTLQMAIAYFCLRFSRLFRTGVNQKGQDSLM